MPRFLAPGLVITGLTVPVAAQGVYHRDGSGGFGAFGGYARGGSAGGPAYTAVVHVAGADVGFS